MDPITLLLIAVGLSMDAFSVSICSGMASHGVKLPYALRIAGFFGASSIERLPTERAIRGQVQEFKNLKLA